MAKRPQSQEERMLGERRSEEGQDQCPGEEPPARPPRAVCSAHLLTT